VKSPTEQVSVPAGILIQSRQVAEILRKSIAGNPQNGETVKMLSDLIRALGDALGIESPQVISMQEWKAEHGRN
jgi:hypothetical protein